MLQCRPLNSRPLPAQAEDDIDGGFDLYWLSVEFTGLIASLGDGAEGGLDEHRWTADRASIFHGAGFGDGSFDDDRSLDPSLFGNRGINGADRCKQPPVGHSGGDADGARFWLGFDNHLGRGC